MRKDGHDTFIYGSLFPLLSASLKGISQVFLIEKNITGFIILIAITVSSYSLGIITLLSAIIGTLVGKFGGADERLVNKGLMGYNSVLTGMALHLFLSGPYMWVVALVGSALAAIITAALMQFMGEIGIPILSFPYIILTWSILLATYKLDTIKLSPALTPQNLLNWEFNTGGKIHFIDYIFNGIGQIYFLANAPAGILIFIAVFWAGRKLGIYAAIGNVVAFLTAYILGGEHTLIMLGLYGYNAILTIVAVSVVFTNENSRITPLIGILAAVLSVPITASVSILLLPYGLPALTMPFVLSTWLILGARKVLPRL